MKKLLGLIIVILLVSCKQEPKLIYEDNFDGSSLDETAWNYKIGNGCPNLCGWGNNERQFYTKENLKLENGHLVITATHKDSLYESSRITTKGKVEFQYGTVEVRAQLPKGHGLWPAIWMLGNDIETNPWPACGEIDIMEYVGREPHTVFNSLHTAASFGNTVNTKKTRIENIEEGFHVYKMNWSEESIDFFVDDIAMYSFSPKVKNDQTWPFNKPYYMLINMAIGGNFGGPDVDDSIFPQEFKIDYIRIYEP